MSEAIPMKTNRSWESSFREMVPRGKSHLPTIIKYSKNCSINNTQVSAGNEMGIETWNKKFLSLSNSNCFWLIFYIN